MYVYYMCIYFVFFEHDRCTYVCEVYYGNTIIHQLLTVCTHDAKKECYDKKWLPYKDSAIRLEFVVYVHKQ